jgi:hypothetical protein
MKNFILFSFIFLVAMIGCQQSTKNATDQNRIDSLEQQVADAYKPGLGEFM